MNAKDIDIFFLKRRWRCWMPKDDDAIIDEVYAIRLALHEQTKHMTGEEFIEFIRKETAPIHKKLGITPVHKIDNPHNKKSSG
jgi:hypothetical protein